VWSLLAFREYSTGSKEVGLRVAVNSVVSVTVEAQKEALQGGRKQ
jgi:hypothetical protein